MGLAFLPPHSPEPEPQGRAWDGPQEKFLANRLFRSLDAVVGAVAGGAAAR